jgi:uncharacterized protein YbjQ (UPF0145 family)
MSPERSAPPAQAAETGADHRPFVSTLSVAGYALTSAAGLVPLGAVMGCDVRSLSIQLPLPVYRQAAHPASPVPDHQYEDDVVAVDELDRHVTQARHRAFDHLCAEAARAGADAVLDLRHIQSPLVAATLRVDPGAIVATVRPGPHPYVGRTVDFQLIGTAVRDPANRSHQPQLGSVSAAEFWKLQQGGWRPVGVVGGCAHRFGASLWAGSVAREVHGSTAIWTLARQAAFAQLKDELRELAADGVIGIKTVADHQIVDWNERVELLGRTGRPRRSMVARQGMLVSVSVIGTAVRRVPNGAGNSVSPTRTLGLGRP